MARHIHWYKTIEKDDRGFRYLGTTIWYLQRCRCGKERERSR